jgi:type I restriction enzyme S subunit
MRLIPNQFSAMKYFKQIFDRRYSERSTFGLITQKMIFNRGLENQQLIELRDWLLPMLMSGQVTVK